MSDNPSGKSHVKTWALSIVLVLVLYVGSVGPMEGLARNGTFPNPPKALVTLYEPLRALGKTPLNAPLNAYVKWWCIALKKS